MCCCVLWDGIVFLFFPPIKIGPSVSSHKGDNKEALKHISVAYRESDQLPVPLPLITCFNGDF